jgi:Caspase domain
MQMKVANTYALLIGISVYDNLGLVPRASVDIQDLHDVLHANGYAKDNMLMVLDSEVTKCTINKALNWLANDAQPNDTVLIFFSGHGIQKTGGFDLGEYLCPVEASEDHLRDTCISNEELAKALYAVGAERLAVFLDACHAGGVGNLGNQEEVRYGLSEKTYNDLAQTRGRVIISSCRAGEVSHELQGMRNGLFASWLLDGLRGGAARGDGTIWMTNLYSYISERASQYGLQHPLLKSLHLEDFKIFPVRNRTLSPLLPPLSPVMFSSSPMDQLNSANVDRDKLAKFMENAYNEREFETLCMSLKVHRSLFAGFIDPLQRRYALIDYFERREGNYQKLLRKVIMDRPERQNELLKEE